MSDNYPHWLDPDLYLEVAENVINGMSDEDIDRLSERQVQVRCLKVYHQTRRSLDAAADREVALNPFAKAARQLVKGAS